MTSLRSGSAMTGRKSRANSSVSAGNSEDRQLKAILAGDRIASSPPGIRKWFEMRGAPVIHEIGHKKLTAPYCAVAAIAGAVERDGADQPCRLSLCSAMQATM